MASGNITGTTSLHSSDYTFWIDWSSAKDTINNRSTVTATAYVKSNGSWDSDTVNANFTQELTINGNSTSKNIRVNIPKGGTVTLISHSVTVSHNENGSKSITISANCRLGTASYSPGTGTASQSVSLDSIDRSAPAVSFTTSNITTNSIDIKATTNVDCDVWWYRIRDGITWTQYSTSNTKSTSTTISGLSPATQYKLQVCARKTSNHVEGFAEKMTTTAEDTPGAPTTVSATCRSGSDFFDGSPVTIQWSGAVSPIQSFEVQYALKPLGSASWGVWQDLTTVATTATSGSCLDNTHNGIRAGMQIKYRVRARNGTPASAYKESAPLTRIGGLWVKAGALWKYGTVWQNVGGVWKQAGALWYKNASWSRAH